MKRLLLVLGCLLLTVVLTLAVRQDNGYILLRYADWSIEGSLVLFALLGLLLYFLAYLVLLALRQFWRLPRRVRDWSGRRQAALARRSLTQGLLELAEGKWKAAEKHLTQHAALSETPLLNYLSAARAAQLQGAQERRDEYLHQAHKSMPSASLAIGLTQADLQLAHQEFEQALATLTHIRSLTPHHPYVLTLLQRLYTELKDWPQLEALLPELREHKILTPDALDDLTYRVYRERLAAMPKSEDLEAFWQALPKAVRNHSLVRKEYLRLLVGQGQGEHALTLIANSLSKLWDDELCLLFGSIAGSQPANQLATAEGWLNEHPDNPQLLLALARLSLRNRLWGKARSYLEASIAIRPSAQAYQELGVLLEQLGETDNALASYRTGLELTLNMPLSKPTLAYPAKPERAKEKIRMSRVN